MRGVEQRRMKLQQRHHLINVHAWWKWLRGLVTISWSISSHDVAPWRSAKYIEPCACTHEWDAAWQHAALIRQACAKEIKSHSGNAHCFFMLPSHENRNTSSVVCTTAIRNLRLAVIAEVECAKTYVHVCILPKLDRHRRPSTRVDVSLVCD